MFSWIRRWRMTPEQRMYARGYEAAMAGSPPDPKIGVWHGGGIKNYYGNGYKDGRYARTGKWTA